MVRLTEEDRRALEYVVHKGKTVAYRRTHAHILLGVDEGSYGPGLLDCEVADRVGVNERAVSRLRQRCMEEGVAAALERKTRMRE